MKPATQGTGHESRHGRHKLGSIFRGGIPGLMCASKACRGGVQTRVTRPVLFYKWNARALTQAFLNRVLTVKPVDSASLGDCTPPPGSRSILMTERPDHERPIPATS